MSTSPSAPKRLPEWGAFALVALVYLIVATREIALPGIYMDAVNPDYLVTRWLNPHAQWIPPWIAPGNDLLGRYPVLVGLHHGSLQLWLGYPAYFIFGMTVAGLRLTHAMFGLGVLAALYGMLRTTRLPRTWAVATGVVLALDPSFVYAFRTSSYITMAPVALLLLAVVCVEKARVSEARARDRWLLACGGLGGLATWGYFIYAFFVPVLMIAAWVTGPRGQPRRARIRQLAMLGAGIAAGGSGYALGYALLAYNTGGIAGAWGHVIAVQPGLGIAGAAVPFAARVEHLSTIWQMVVSNAWNHVLIFGDTEPTWGVGWKFKLLVGAPPVLWLALEAQRRAPPVLRILLGLELAFLGGAFAFGTRLGGHHFMPLVPLSYAALACALHALGTGAKRPVAATAASAAALGVVAVLATVNVAGDARELDALRRTGGVAYYSDAINHLGADLLAGDHHRLLVFPDWGLFMPTVFLTHATMEMAAHDDYALARRRLCEGKDVVVCLITGDRGARFRDWQQRLGWGTPDVVAYRQRDGRVAFEVATFAGKDAAVRCGTEATAVSSIRPFLPH